MEKQMKDFLKLERDKEKPEHLEFYLDDFFEFNPTVYCPKCKFKKVAMMHTHNLDGYDYRCKNCSGTYTLNLSNREDYDF